ncbi:MAG: tail fiber protein [Theionarchaea archaeon]|nr:tail fiber protein [Theionarchaea archaeon]DBA34801.1 TPA_asm: tail fiber protein [Caudoviricetes sp. vir521]
MNITDQGEQKIFGRLTFENEPPQAKDPILEYDLVNLRTLEARLLVLEAKIGLVGEIKIWPVATAPANYLLLDGKTLGNTGSGANYEGDDYHALYDLIQNTFGGTYNWAGLGTVNLPDLRDNFLLIMGATYALASTGGVATHTLTITEIPAHTHGLNMYTSGGGAQPTRVSGTGLAPATTSSTGGGGAHENMPPYLTMNAIVRYKT